MGGWFNILETTSCPHHFRPANHASSVDSSPSQSSMAYHRWSHRQKLCLDRCCLLASTLNVNHFWRPADDHTLLVTSLCIPIKPCPVPLPPPITNRGTSSEGTSSQGPSTRCLPPGGGPGSCYSTTGSARPLPASTIPDRQGERPQQITLGLFPHEHC